MDIFNHIAEQKIQEAMDRGVFEDLPNKGQKLDLRVDPFVPPELQMGYRILKNAGILPNEIVLDKEITSLKDLLDQCHCKDEKQNLQSKIRSKVLLLDLLRERNGRSIALQDYLEKLETTEPLASDI